MPTTYEPEMLSPDDDDGTMVENVQTLADAVVGHRVTEVHQRARVPNRWGDGSTDTGTVLVLDNGTKVGLRDTDDCCAYTELKSITQHLDRVNHVITGVGTTDGFTTWHIYADLGDVIELGVGWSCGNPFYYGYGFDISVVEMAADG